MTFSNDWTVTNNPADHSKFQDQPSHVRKVRTDLEERFANFFYGFVSGETTEGVKMLNLTSQGSDPSAPSAGNIRIYSKTISTKSELFLRHESAGVIQLTSLGKILANILTIASEARGDLLARGASAWDRLALGASGTYLRSNGTDPVYSALQASDIEAAVLTPKNYTDVSDTSTSDEAAGSTSYADTLLSLTFTVGKQGLVFANFSGHSDGGSGYGHQIALLVDGTIVHEIRAPGGSGDTSKPVIFAWQGVLSAGSHTIKVQHKRVDPSIAGTLKGTLVTSRLNVSHPA